MQGSCSKMAEIQSSCTSVSKVLLCETLAQAWGPIQAWWQAISQRQRTSRLRLRCSAGTGKRQLCCEGGQLGQRGCVQAMGGGRQWMRRTCLHSGRLRMGGRIVQLLVAAVGGGRVRASPVSGGVTVGWGLAWRANVRPLLLSWRLTAREGGRCIRG